MDNTITIKNGRILLPNGDMQAYDLLMQDGLIREIGEGIEGGEAIDAGGAYVVPGLIDLHTHGIHFETASTSSLAEFARIESSHGATTFYPTLFAPPGEIAAQMERHLAETDDFRQTPQVGGFRLESPYIARTGAGVSRDIAPISPEITNMLLKAGRGYIKIWDISPELPGAPDVIGELSGKGIVCSLAHTSATVEQGRAAVDAGAKLVTHLFDVFDLPQTTEPGVYPAGLVDYFLVEDRLCVEIIGDGTHVSPLNVEKTFRCKTHDRIVFITDSNLGAGLPPGKYTLPGGWGDAVVSGPNNGVRMPDRDMGLAGSALTPIDNFRNVMRLFGKDMATASRVCSRTPARLLGLNKGEVAVGRDADLIILDSDLNLLYTICAGKVVFTGQ